MFFGGNDVNAPGALYLPAGITLTQDPNLLAFFDKVRDPDFNVHYLILVANEYGPAYINIYGFGEAKKGSALAAPEENKNKKVEEKGTGGVKEKQEGVRTPEIGNQGTGAPKGEKK